MSSMNHTHNDEVVNAGFIEIGRGQFFNLLVPDPAGIHPTDVGQSLGNQCRFTGFTRRFYSVAEHSVILSHLVDPEHAKAALIHDAPEAYVKDTARPLKKAYPITATFEDPIWAVMAPAWGVDLKLPDQVVEYDMRICSNEKIALLSPNWEEQEHWRAYIEKYPPLPGVEFAPFCPPEVAGVLWVSRFNELFGTEHPMPSIADVEAEASRRAVELLVGPSARNQLQLFA